ncbi:MAG TPA: hypothetical protein DEO84_01295, partial [candidate division Zixibacteria bacterium]|nr:hypothetical protein [candidate division Zixibacteria bacterium]
MKPLIAILLILLYSSVAYADRYEYDAQVNQYIPEGDSAGIRDTIFIPIHAPITDINFYVGVGIEDQPWGTVILIDVFSPNRQRVRLHDAEVYHLYWYNVWYNTERQESGPGQLEDYAGEDAYGPWEMYCFNPFQSQSLTWYGWRIELITSTDAAEEKALFPTEYAISGAYPNPFNSSMAIEYSIPEISQVKLDVYDICGRRVRALINSEQAAGYYRAVWDGT